MALPSTTKKTTKKEGNTIKGVSLKAPYATEIIPSLGNTAYKRDASLVVTEDDIKNIPSSVIKKTRDKIDSNPKSAKTESWQTKAIDTALKIGQLGNPTVSFNKNDEKLNANNVRNSVSPVATGTIPFLQNAITDKVKEITTRKDRLAQVDVDIDKWLDTSYKMSDDEIRKAKEVVNDYYKNSYNRDNWTEEKQKEFEKIVALENKTSLGSTIMSGIADAMPFTDTLGKNADKTSGTTQYADATKNAQTQNPLAYGGGYLGGTLAEYGLGSQLMTSLPVVGQALGKAGETVSKIPVLGKVGAERATRVLGDTTLDVALDTIPQLVSNVKDGKTKEEVAGEALKNVGTNLAFNMGGEALGSGIEFMQKSKQTRKMLEEIANEVPTINKNVNNATAEQFANLNPLQFGNTKSTNTVLQSADDITNIPLGNAKADITPNYASMEYSEIPYVKNQDAKNLLDSTVDRIKKDTDYALKTFKDGTDRSELVAQANKALDDFAMNPSEENYLNVIATRNKLNDSMQGTKYKSKRYKTVSVYDNDIARTFNAEADKLYKSATDAYGNVDSIPRLDSSMYQQQGTPFEYDTFQEIPVLKDTKNVADASKGVNNVNVADTSKQADANMKVSQARTNTAENSGAFTEEQGKKYFDEKDFLYESKTEQQSMEQAQDFIAKNGSNSWKILENRENFTNVDTDSAMTLWKDKCAEANALEEAGQDATAVWQEANLMFRKIREQATMSAQNLQALAKWTRNTPEGIVAQTATETMQQVKKLFGNDKIATAEFDKVWDKVSVDVTRYAQQAYGAGLNTRQGQLALAQIGKVLDANMPKSFGGVIKTFLMDNMLGNFRTLISRNAFGNAFYNVSEFARQPITAGIDSVVGLKTGKRTRTGINAEKMKSALQGATQGLKAEFNDITKGVHTAKSGFNSIEEVTKLNKHAFQGKNIATKALNKVDDMVKHGLSMGDRPFYESAYAQRMTELQQLRAKNQLGADIAKMSDDEFNTWAELSAKLDGLVATYQDDTLIAKAFNGLKKAIADASTGATGTDVLSQFSMAFTNTPGNIITRSIEYSPLGVVKNTLNTGKEILGKNFNQQRFVDETGRNILGTGLFAGGLAAANNGLITGSYSDDADMKNAQKNAGMQEHALNTGNANVSIDWIPVLGNNLVSASAFLEAYNNSDGNTAQAIGDGTKASIDALFNTSALQGMNRLFGGNTGYSTESSLADNVVSSFQSGLGQFTPSLGRQIGQVADEYQRDISSGDNPYWQNNLINQIPFLRESLQPKVDNEGNLVKQNQGRSTASKIFENMLSPANYTELSDSVVNNEAMRLFDATGAKTQFLPTASRTNDFKSMDIELNDEEYTAYKQEFGKNNSKVAETVINSDYYKGLSDEQKVDVLGEIYSGMKAFTLNSMYGKETDSKIAEMYDYGGAESVVEYLEYKDTISNIGASDTDKMRDLWNNGGADTVMTYNEVKSASTVVNENGNDTIDKTLLFNNLASMPNLTDEDRGYYYYNLAKTDKLTQIVSDMGFEAVYRYAQYKLEADVPGKKTGTKDGSISCKEAINYLNQQNMTADEKRYWYSVMAPSNYQNKNPY